MRTLTDAWYSLVGFVMGTKTGHFQWNGYHYLVIKDSRWARHADCYQFDRQGNETEDAPRPPADLIMRALDMDPDDSDFTGVHWETDWKGNE